MGRGPALGVLELSSVARGVVTADAALKRAPSVLVSSRAVSGGKHLVIVEGGVAEVEESMAAGRAAARASVSRQAYGIGKAAGQSAKSTGGVAAKRT